MVNDAATIIREDNADGAARRNDDGNDDAQQQNMTAIALNP